MKLILLSIVFFFFVFSDARASSPKDNYLHFWQCIKEEKYESANKMIFPISDTSYLSVQMSNSIKSSTKLKQGKIEIAVLESKIKDNWALLVVHIKVEREMKKEESIQYELMAIHNKKWKYVFKQKTNDQALKNHSAEALKDLKKWWYESRGEIRSKHYKKLAK